MALLHVEAIDVEARVRAAPGEQAFSAAWEHGKALSPEQAVALALEGPSEG